MQLLYARWSRLSGAHGRSTGASRFPGGGHAPRCWARTAKFGCLIRMSVEAAGATKTCCFPIVGIVVSTGTAPACRCRGCRALN